MSPAAHAHFNSLPDRIKMPMMNVIQQCVQTRSANHGTHTNRERTARTNATPKVKPPNPSQTSAPTITPTHTHTRMPRSVLRCLHIDTTANSGAVKDMKRPELMAGVAAATILAPLLRTLASAFKEGAPQ